MSVDTKDTEDPRLLNSKALPRPGVEHIAQEIYEQNDIKLSTEMDRVIVGGLDGRKHVIDLGTFHCSFEAKSGCSHIRAILRKLNMTQDFGDPRQNQKGFKSPPPSNARRPFVERHEKSGRKKPRTEDTMPLGSRIRKRVAFGLPTAPVSVRDDENLAEHLEFGDEDQDNISSTVENIVSGMDVDDAGLPFGTALDKDEGYATVTFDTLMSKERMDVDVVPLTPKLPEPTLNPTGSSKPAAIASKAARPRSLSRTKKIVQTLSKDIIPTKPGTSPQQAPQHPSASPASTPMANTSGPVSMASTPAQTISHPPKSTPNSVATTGKISDPSAASSTPKSTSTPVSNSATTALKPTSTTFSIPAITISTADETLPSPAPRSSQVAYSSFIPDSSLTAETAPAEITIADTATTESVIENLAAPNESREVSSEIKEVMSPGIEALAENLYFINNEELRSKHWEDLSVEEKKYYTGLMNLSARSLLCGIDRKPQVLELNEDNSIRGELPLLEDNMSYIQIKGKDNSKCMLMKMYNDVGVLLVNDAKVIDERLVETSAQILCNSYLCADEKRSLKIGKKVVKGDLNEEALQLMMDMTEYNGKVQLKLKAKNPIGDTKQETFNINCHCNEITSAKKKVKNLTTCTGCKEKFHKGIKIYLQFLRA